MLERYSRKVLRDLWSEENKFNAYLQVEILNAKALNTKGIVTDEEISKIEKNAKFDIDKIKEIEEQTKHDVVAFTRAVSLSLGDESKWIHYGLTSTDVVDTAYGYVLRQVNDIISTDLDNLLSVLKKQALKYKYTPCIGRTHGIHADITSFGLKWALWYDECLRNIKRFNDVRSEIEIGKLSGAVGNFANIDPFIEEYICKHLKINNASISTQVIQRDRHANYLSVLALIAAFLEKMAFEVRSLQRTEVNEVNEAFAKGQKGSSAMPHKRNPISSENICGCARVIRGYMLTSFENVALWHERDISHSSTERIILPDATMLVDYMLTRFTSVLDNLVVYEENMLKNIYKTNKVIFAQRVMNKLIEKGLTREVAYDLIQSIAIIAMDNSEDYQHLLLSNNQVKKYLTATEVDSCFTLEYYMKNVDTIYHRLNLK